jgi:LCP family protein required for cell wall assembly
MPDDRLPSHARGMWKRFLVGALIISVLAGAATATAGLEEVSSLAGKLFPRSHQFGGPKGLVVPDYSGGPVTFLLIGSDRRALAHDVFDRGNAPHSDTLLLVRFDPNAGQTSVLSIPRDLEVSIQLPGGRIVAPVAKINEAYTLGPQYFHNHDPGATLAAETVKRLLHIRLNAVIDTTFSGFLQVVGKLGCVYVNVDRRYYIPPNTGVASIDLQPGYQKLCYENALDYVRFRHFDSDFVRVARQQAFLRAAREQISVGTLAGHLDSVANTIGQAMYTAGLDTDPGHLISLLQLLSFSQKKPLRQVKFAITSETGGGTAKTPGTYVTATPEQIHHTVEDFLHGDQHVTTPTGAGTTGPAGSGHHHAKRHPRSLAQSAAAAGLYPVASSARAAVVNAGAGVPFPIEFPTYQTGPAQLQGVHVYHGRDREGKPYTGYIGVFQVNNDGGYYDVNAMTWTHPPFTRNPSGSFTLGGRQYSIVSDGGQVNLVYWRQHGVLYWVNNTLLEELSNTQLIDIARSMQRVH